MCTLGSSRSGSGMLFLPRDIYIFITSLVQHMKLSTQLLDGPIWPNIQLTPIWWLELLPPGEHVRWACMDDVAIPNCFSRYVLVCSPFNSLKDCSQQQAFFFFILNTDTYFSKCLLQVGESHWLYKLTCENSNRGRLLCLAFGLWVLHLNDFVL